jgi:hypothetical protein
VVQKLGLVEPNISIDACTELPDQEGIWEAAAARAEAKERRADALERGKLELFDEELKRLRWWPAPPPRQVPVKRSAAHDCVFQPIVDGHFRRS